MCHVSFLNKFGTQFSPLNMGVRGFMNTERTIYIEALKYASERDSFTIQELFERLQLSEDQKHRLAVQISNKEIFFHTHVNYLKSYREGKNISLSMSVEDEFRLLEYTELIETRASSKQATYFATAALAISIVATISSVVFSYSSSKSEINYPVDLKAEIKNISKETRNLVEELRRENSSNKKIKLD